MCRMLENDAAVGQSFKICGEPGRDSYWDHLIAWRAAGLRVPKLVVPIPFPTRRAFSIEKARTLLGWSPRSLADGFADLVRFEKEVGEALAARQLAS